MKSLTPAQSEFLRSAILHILREAAEPVSLTLTDKEENRALLTLRIDGDETPTLSRNDSAAVPHPMTVEAMAELILQEWKNRGETILIAKGGETIRLRLRGDSILREPVTVAPAALRQPIGSVGKTTHLHPAEAAPLLRAIGLMTPEGEIKAPMRRKFKQVNHFLDLLTPLLREKTDSGPFTVVDCGCGKSYLGFVLYWYLRRVLKRPAAFLGVDVSEKLIEQCRDRAEQMGLREMRFQCGAILDAEFPPTVHLLVSLHACATDEAIACGVVENAEQIVVAPCCRHEIAGQLSGIPMYPIPRHGIFTQRFGELLTDLLRALFLEAHGYTVTAGEFVSVQETPMNLLLRASRGNSAAQKRLQEYEAFKKYYNLSSSIDRFKTERELRRRVL